jgi:hypothetical protein
MTWSTPNSKTSTNRRDGNGASRRGVALTGVLMVALFAAVGGVAGAIVPDRRIGGARRHFFTSMAYNTLK